MAITLAKGEILFDNFFSSVRSVELWKKYKSYFLRSEQASKQGKHFVIISHL